MAGSGRKMQLAAAFIVGAAVIPMTLGLAGAWLTLASPDPCGGGLCFRGLIELLVSGLASALVAGVVAQRFAGDISGWAAMMGGLVSAILVLRVLGDSSVTYEALIVLLGGPAAVAYLVAGVLSGLRGDTPGRSTAIGGAEVVGADGSRDGDDQCESCGAPLRPGARSCSTCGSAVLT